MQPREVMGTKFQQTGGEDNLVNVGEAEGGQ
jgi:hypothetical protein